MSGGLDIQGIVHSNLTPSSMTQLKEVSKNLPGSHLAMKGRQIPENQSRMTRRNVVLSESSSGMLATRMNGLNES